MSDPKLKVVVEVDGKQYAAELDKLDQKTESLGSTAKNSAAGVSQLVGQMKSLYGIAAAYGGLRLVQFVASTNAEFERLQTTLAAVEGSSEKAKVVFADLETLAATTPFQLQQMTDGYIKLKTFGLDPLDGTYQAIIDQSAMLGGSQQTLEGIILALGQAWAKQKLQGEEIMQLVERGVPVWALLEKATGKNTIELQKLSEQGKLGRIEIKALIDEMGAASVGAAAAQINTLNGLFSNLEDSIARAAKAFGEGSGFNDQLKAAAQELTKFFDWIGGGNETKALKIFREQVEPNIELLKSFGIALDNLDPTSLERMNRVLDAAKRNNIDLAKEAPLSNVQKEIRAVSDHYAALAKARDVVVKSMGPESAAAQQLGAQLGVLEGKLKTLTGSYIDLARPKKAKAITAPVEAPKTDFAEAQAYSKYMYELARQAYPEATQSAEEYGEAMAKLLVAQNEAENSAYYDRLAAAEQVVRDNYTATELYTDAMIRLNAQWQAGDISTETYVAALGKAKKEMDDFGRKGDDTFKQLESAVRGWGNAFTDTMADMVMDGKASFSDLADSIIRDLLRIQIQKGITQPLMDGGTAWLNGLFGASSTGAPTATPNAKGNIFNHGDIVPFAVGGIVSSPTYFPMRGGKTGLMGEAGEEAIMPLRRTSDGSLGVRAQVGGALENVRVVLENHGSAKEATATDIKFDGRELVIGVLIEDQRRNGPITKGFEQRWNLRQGAR